MSPLAVIWSATGLRFATHVDSVIEVLPPLAWSPTPAVPIWVRGLFSFRDQLIPLVDVAALLGSPRVPDRMMNRVLVVRRGDAHAADSWPVGLWVENVLELDRLDFEANGTHPGFQTEAGRFLGSVAQTRWGQVQLVNPMDIFTPEQAAVLSERLSGVAA